MITVILVDAANRPVVGQDINLTVHVPLIRQTCTTDSDGRCTFSFSAAGELLRGDLVIVGRGRRSLTWKGDQLDIPLQLTDNGEIEVAADYIPTATPEPLILTLTETPPVSPTAMSTAEPTQEAAPSAPTIEAAATVTPAQPTAVWEPAPTAVLQTDAADSTTNLLWAILIGSSFASFIFFLVGIAWWVQQRRDAS